MIFSTDSEKKQLTINKLGIISNFYNFACQ